nr:unnamed protein product [Callosobruchus chinensis]
MQHCTLSSVWILLRVNLEFLISFRSLLKHWTNALKTFVN